VIWPGGSTRN